MRGTVDRLSPLAWVVGGAAALGLAFGHGFANYDSFYSLVWGNEIFHGESPDYSAGLTPTPHPLATLVGVLLAPLGDGAETALVVIAFLALAAIGYLVYRLGELWFNRWVGLLAAAIVLSREPVLDYGSRAYVDLPYIALILAALVLETKRPRAGWPVLALLGLAGLLRPEAWLFSGVYLLYLAYTAPHRPKGRLGPLRLLYRRDELLGLAALAAAAPLAWAAFDLIVTGDALYSLTGTRDTVSTLHRDTGLDDALRLGPRRIGEILREPVAIAAAGGAIFGLLLLRRRVEVGVAAVAVALGAFLLLAAAGLAVITRYLLLASALLAIFGAGGALGWLSVESGNRLRTWWIAFGAAVIAGILVLGPQQFDRLEDLRERVAEQEQIRDDLHDLADGLAPEPSCPVAISDYQGVPLLALWLDRRPSSIISPSTFGSQESSLPTRHTLISPATEQVAELFALDPNAPRLQIAAGQQPLGQDWFAVRNCAV